MSPPSLYCHDTEEQQVLPGYCTVDCSFPYILVFQNGSRAENWSCLNLLFSVKKCFWGFAGYFIASISLTLICSSCLYVELTCKSCFIFINFTTVQLQVLLRFSDIEPESFIFRTKHTADERGDKYQCWFLFLNGKILTWRISDLVSKYSIDPVCVSYSLR